MGKQSEKAEEKDLPKGDHKEGLKVLQEWRDFETGDAKKLIERIIGKEGRLGRLVKSKNGKRTIDPNSVAYSADLDDKLYINQNDLDVCTELLCLAEEHCADLEAEYKEARGKEMELLAGIVADTALKERAEARVRNFYSTWIKAKAMRYRFSMQVDKITSRIQILKLRKTTETRSKGTYGAATT